MQRIGAIAGLAALLSSCGGQEADFDRDAVIEEVLSEESEAQVRATCSTCHVFPPPDILPGPYWTTAINGMYRIAADRGIDLPIQPARVAAWYLLKAPDTLPPAPGRTDAGPGPLTWATEGWRPPSAATPEDRSPAVTHLRMANVFDGPARDLIVSDVSTNGVYVLSPYTDDPRPRAAAVIPNPGRTTVTDLDEDGRMDLVVAALGDLKPTNDPVGSVVWLRQSASGSLMPVPLVEGLGRVADVHAADMNGDARTDLAVAVFGWMENGGLFWLENTGPGPDRPEFEPHVLDQRPGFTDVRSDDLNGDGHTDLVALIAQEFQQVMVYWGGDDGFTSEVVFQAPNPDWGFTGLEVADFTGNGLTDVIVTNGDNLDLTVAKPFHGVAMLENQGEGRFEYRHLTSMYGAHRAVPVDLDGSGRLGLLVSAYLPPTVASAAPAPREALVWLQRTGPTHLVRRVLSAEGVHHMAMDAGDITGDGRADIALGFMDLGVVDPRQAHQGPPLPSFVELWRLQAPGGSAGSPAPADVIDWTVQPSNSPSTLR